MKVVLQRVDYAKVFVKNQLINEVKRGYLLLIGFKNGDNLADVEYLAKKISALRVFEDENHKLNLSILDVKGEILAISQFTLYGDFKKGNRPSFTESMEYHKAEKMYLEFTRLLKEKYQIEVKNGVFGEHMKIELINDGPVTMILEC